MGIESDRLVESQEHRVSQPSWRMSGSSFAPGVHEDVPVTLYTHRNAAAIPKPKLPFRTGSQNKESNILACPPNSTDHNLIGYEWNATEPWMEQRPGPWPHKTQRMLGQCTITEAQLENHVLTAQSHFGGVRWECVAVEFKTKSWTVPLVGILFLGWQQNELFLLCLFSKSVWSWLSCLNPN